MRPSPEGQKLKLIEQMKKWFNLGALLLMVSGSLVFTSCKDDDDDNEERNERVFAEWIDDEKRESSITVNV